MNQSINNQKYTLAFEGVTLFIDSAEFNCGTQISKYTVLDKRIDVAIEGATPKKLTIKGRFLPSDFSKINSCITSNTGQVIPHLILNNYTYVGMILIEGKAEINASEVFGNMVLVFQST